MQPGAAATTTTRHTTSSCNNNNVNNLTLAIMHRTTKAKTITIGTSRKTRANSKFHKRRRRRQRSSRITTARTATTTVTPTPTTISRTTTRTPTTTTRRYSIPNLSRTGAYLTLLLLTTTCSLCASVSVSDFGSETSVVTTSNSAAAGVGESIYMSSPCASNHWWDQLKGKCTPCTSCPGEMIALRPCQPHVDTHCGSIYDLKIDWVLLAKTERNWKERRKSSEYEHFDQPTPLQHLTHEQLQQLHEEAAAALPPDWQTGALFIAVLACLLFFSVAAIILIHHMRQWRRMERRLDQDVEELSTKLMAKLAEVQSLDGGTFFIGNADALRGLPASAVTAASAAASAAHSGIFQPQHVLLPVEKHAKHQERRILKTLQPGNVYIEENNAVGVGIIPNFKG